MVMKNIYSIKIIVSIFLMHTSLHPMMRLARAAASRKNHSHMHVQSIPKFVVTNNKRNQRTLSHVSNRNVAVQKKSVVNAQAPMFKNNIQPNVQILPEPVEQNNIKNSVVPPVHVEQNNTKKVKIVEQSIETPKVSIMADTVTPKNKIDNSLKTNKAKKNVQSFVEKNKIDIGDPYANVKGSDVLAGNNKSTQQKKEKYNKEPEEITDLYNKRWQEFNASKKQFNQNNNVEHEESRAEQPTRHMIVHEESKAEQPTKYIIVHKNDANEIDAVLAPVDNQPKEGSFQFGEAFANGMNTVGNMFDGNPKTRKTEVVENVLPKNNLNHNDTDESFSKNKENLNANANKKPANADTKNTESLQVGQLVANSTNEISNRLSAVWQYGKNGLTNVWNNCTTPDFWLKPYEVFSAKVLEKDSANGGEVLVIKSKLHAMFLKHFKDKKDTADIAYFLTRTGMVILGMALFWNPSLITTNGAGQITTRLFAAVAQLVSGGSLASVVTVVTGPVLIGYASALSSWASGCISSIGIFNQIYNYRFRKDSANEPLKNKPDTVSVVENSTSQNADKNSENNISHETLQAQFNALDKDPKAQEYFVKFCLQFEELQKQNASQ